VAQAGDLISQSDFYLLTGFTETDVDEELVKWLIAAASRFVRDYTQQEFVAAEYREHRSGNGRRTLYLRQRPIIDVISVRGPARVDSFRVKYTGAGSFASVEVEDDTSLILRTSASGTLTPTTLTFADNPTLTALAAAVGAVTGWEAERLTTADAQQESKELLPLQAGDALDGWLTLCSADDPVDDYVVEDDRSGRITRRLFEWTAAVHNWVFRYRAGYGTVGETDATKAAKALPHSLRFVAAGVVKWMYHNRDRDATLAAERVGRRSVTYAMSTNDGLPEHIRRRLDWWARTDLT